MSGVEEPDPEEVLARLQGTYWFDIGRRSANAHLNRTDWLFRRVESLQFMGRRSLQRQVSVDFEMPRLPRLRDHAPRYGRLVPVSVFAKWPPLADFDLIGPDGQPRSLYVRDTNKQLDLGLLFGMAAPLARLTPRLQALLALLVDSNEPPPEGLGDTIDTLWSELREANPNADERRIHHIADTVNLAAQLANSSILWVPVTATRGADCIVKFSYRIGYKSTRSLRQLLIACSWYDRVLYIPLPHAGQYTRYHLDVGAANAGVEFVRAQTFVFPGEPGGGRQGSNAAAAAIPPYEPVGVAEPLASSDIIDRHAHIYHPLRTSPSHRVVLQLVIAATREGFVSGCLIVSAALAVLMSLAYAALPEAASHLEPLVVLLAAVPLVLGYLMVRTEEPLEREHVTGVRAMALLAGIMPIVGALTLVFAPHSAGASAPELDTARPVWAGLTIVSWLLVIGLGWSWALACTGKDRPRERRPANIAATAGLFGAGCIALGAILDCQPYAHVKRAKLAGYLHTHLALVIAGSALLAVGVISVHAVIGAIRRTERHSNHIAARTTPVKRAATALLFTAAALWIWGTVAAAALTIWQTITQADGTEVRSLMRTADILANATLVPAAVLVICASAWLIVYRGRVAGGWQIVVLGGVLAAALVTLRGLSVLDPRLIAVSPKLACIALAAWIAYVSVALHVSLTLNRPDTST